MARKNFSMLGTDHFLLGVMVYIPIGHLRHLENPLSKEHIGVESKISKALISSSLES